jgi:ABC-type multidrug transport system fused ATPase/permease subunit
LNYRIIRSLARCAPDAGARLLTAIGLLALLQYLAPAGIAVATAMLISRVQHAVPSSLEAAAATPLVLFALVLGIGHAADAALEPLIFLASSRIDGAHRARITELAATSPTVDRLEDSGVQRLIRAGRADPMNWTERTPGAGVAALIYIASSFVGVAASGAVLARFAWWLVPLIVLPALTQWCIFVRRHHAFIARWRDSRAEMMRGHLWERTAADPGTSKDIRVYGLGDWIADAIHEHIRAAFEPIWAKLTAKDEWQVFLLVGIPFSLALAVVGYDAATGRTTVATESAVLAAGWSVFQSLGWSDLTISVVSAGECLAAYDELCDELSAPAAVSADGSRVPSAPALPAARELPDRAPLICVEGLGFRYPGTERTVLDSVDLEIRPGELLALVGLNGAGKSTLIKLLSMLYTPTSGRIAADGVDIADYGHDAWRARISVVFQDFVKYELSAAQNVLLGRGALAPDLEELALAAEEAGFGDVLTRLPDGWDTPLARTRTGGVDLSGGQWQQVVLTRALYALRKGAKLLVLDEPTAHLDVRTEFEVFQRLAERRGEASIVLISHRLSTVRYADRIVLLDNGRITETGTHDELIARGGEYARMFAIQAERFNAGYDDLIEEGELL